MASIFFIVYRPRRMAAGDLSSRRPSSQSTLSSTSSLTRLTSFSSSACAASIGSPVMHISASTRRGSRPPSTLSTCAGNTPTFTSGRPNTAWRLATARSHIAMRPMPPAMQAPLTRAISGTVDCRAWRKRLAMPW
ncbi:hypothetical protein D9M68_419970 [compost metagenome]